MTKGPESGPFSFVNIQPIGPTETGSSLTGLWEKYTMWSESDPD